MVLLDLGLPVMDGFEVARRLREEKNSPHLIAVTGYGQSEDRGRTAKAGFGHHLVKPVSLRELRAALDEAKSLLQNDSKS